MVSDPALYFAAGVLFFGLIFTIQGMRLLKKALILQNRGQRAEAEVIEVIDRVTQGRQDDGPVDIHSYIEVVQFRDWQHNLVTAKLPLKSENETHAEVGDKIGIRYDPEHPETAAPEKKSNLLPVGGVTVLLGNVMLLGGLFWLLKLGVMR